MFIPTTKVNTTNATSKQQDDVIADEEPLEIRLGYIDNERGRVHKSIAITMRSPGMDVELTLGFLFSENVIQSISQIMDIDTSKENLIRIELSEKISFDMKRLERHFYTTSSCGVCAKSLPLLNHGLIVSGRASFELMQKALMAQCPMLVAVGAPSSLAVELAQEFNITLVGFLGDEGFNIYHDDERIII